MEKTQKAEENSLVVRAKSYVKPVLIGAAAGVAAILLLLVLFAVLMAAMHLTRSAVPWLSRIASIAGGFGAGFMAAKLRKKRGLLVGGVTGMFLGLCVLLFGFCISGVFPAAEAASKFVIFVITGLIGGVMGVGNSKRR